MCLFFIVGIIPREKTLGTQTRFCSYCERETTHTLIERRMWFTFFFIPLFPVSRKQVIARCSVCGFEHPREAEPERGFRIPPQPPRVEGMKRCPNCGGEVAEEANFCQYCGHRFSGRG